MQGFYRYSKGADYSTIQKNIKFKLNRDGSATYRFKGENDNYTNERTDGSWNADYKDSSLTINLGQGSGSHIIAGKYLTLGSGSFSVEQVTAIDTIVNGRNLKCKKVTTVYFEN